ncbi:MAG: HipA domain-containing protein [Bacteroidetes bacterium]|nr:HipA domain-containing protein [Bacteroidota bacterium]
MNFPDLKYCPGSLAQGFATYSPTALRRMFDGKKVNHLLDFEALDENEDVAEQFRQNSKIISVSGAQFKQSLLLEKNKLRLTRSGEHGQFILKPIPFRPPFAKAGELPANEHLTMQLAKQVFGIATAENALIFFKNGSPAYITRRFDINASGCKIAQEDFASLSGLSKEKDGNQYRNSGCYEDIADVMKKYVAAYPVEIEKFYEQILFNYLFSNGDAHLKNFSLQQTSAGDYLLSPAYDLIDTSIHIPADSFFALENGLFSNGYETESFKQLGFYAWDDFFEFGIRIGLLENRIVRLLNKYRTENPKVSELIDRSFLSPQIQVLYKRHYLDRLKMLNNSFRKKI